LIGFGFAWLIGPGIFRGNCPCGNFKGRYAGRIGRQDWKSFNFVPDIPLNLNLVFTIAQPSTLPKKKEKERKKMWGKLIEGPQKIRAVVYLGEVYNMM
jgi:hypothetical protein